MRGREKYQCLKSQCADCYSPRIGLCNSRQNSPSFIFRPVIFLCVARPRLPSLLIRKYKIADRIAKLRLECSDGKGKLERGNFGKIINPDPSPTLGSTLWEWCRSIDFFSVAVVKRSSPGSHVHRKDTVQARSYGTDFGAMENCIVGGLG